MRILLAFLLPPLAVLLCGKPVRALLNVLLTACFWIPGVVHALVIVNGHLYEKQTDRTLRAMKSKIAEHHPEIRGPRFWAAGSGWKQWLSSLLLSVLIFYPLSSGPVLRLAESGVFPSKVRDVLQTAYSPILHLAEQEHIVADWLKTWLQWCGVG